MRGREKSRRETFELREIIGRRELIGRRGIIGRREVVGCSALVKGSLCTEEKEIDESVRSKYSVKEEMQREIAPTPSRVTQL